MESLQARVKIAAEKKIVTIFIKEGEHILTGKIKNTIIRANISNYPGSSRNLLFIFKIRTMETTVNYFTTVFLIVVFLLSGVTSAISGNLSLIEQRLQELDQLNKQAVRKAGNIPKNGSIEIEATILPGMAETKSLPGVTEKRFNFGKKTILTLEKKSLFTVQISSSQGKEQCYRVASMLRRAGYPAFTSKVNFNDKGIWHRIFVGSVTTREAAETIKNNLETDEISDGFIRQMPYAIQVGDAAPNLAGFKNLKKKLSSLYCLPYTSYVQDQNNSRQIRLLVGAFKTREDSANLLSGLRQSGLQVRVVNR